MSETTCSTPECDSAIAVKKWRLCKRHYLNARAAGEIEVRAWRHRVVEGACVECGPAAETQLDRGRLTCRRSLQRQKNKLRFGLDQDEIALRLDAIDHRCEICDSKFAPGNPFCIDHDHTCCAKPPTCGACTRGFLCRRCNVALGMLQDNPERADSAADYLRRKIVL